MNGRWRNELYAPTPWAETDIVTGIGGLDAMGGYFLRVPTPRSGDTTVVRKRY